ncbi:MAG TPA: PPC domain-containing protein [Isosphaeraceae bacterium]
MASEGKPRDRSRLGTAQILLAFALTHGLADPGLAQAPRPQPKLLHVFPPGGRAGSTVEVAVGGDALEAADGLWFSHPGIRAERVAGKPKSFKVAIAPATPLGAHDVRALAPDGLSNPRTFVVGALPESSESEPNGTLDAANPIGINAVVNGATAATDVDCFALHAKKGQRLFVSVAAERIDSPLDATLRVLDARGAELAESRDAFGADPFVDVTLPADGRYVIKVHDVTYAGSADHVYRLTVRDGPTLDAAVPPIAAPGRLADLTLLGRGQRARRLPTHSGPEALDASAWLGLPDFRATPDLPVNAFGTAAAMRAFPLRVGRGENPSNPVLVAEASEPIVVEREPNGFDAPQTVTPPCSVGGSFDRRGDVDIYRFVAKKGEAWRIEAISEGIGSQADPTLVVQRVRESSEPEDLVAADDTADPGLAPRFNLATVDANLRWSAPADGTYQILLADVASSSRGDARLTYRLTIRRDRPDFRLFVVPGAINALDATTVRKGGRAGAVVLAWRIDGFGGPILVRAEGLPEGVRCPPVVIPAGAVSAPIIVEADASAKPGVGVLRLVGQDASAKPSDFWAETAPGPDDGRLREAIPGSILRPPPTIQGTAVKVTPARATRGFAVAIREGAPFMLTARPRRAVVAQGQPVELDVSVKPGPGFDDAIAITGWEPPAGMPPPTSSIAKGATSARVDWPVPKGLAPGEYTLVLKGSATHQPDAKGKTKFKVDEPSNPVIVTVRPAPVTLAIASKPTTIKPGESADIEVKIERQGKFAGPVGLSLEVPETSKLRGGPVTIPTGQGGMKLAVATSKDSPVGPINGATVRAEAVVEGLTVEVAVPLPLAIAKP